MLDLNHSLLVYFLRVRTNLYIKVELDHEKDDDLKRIAEEIVRQIRKNYNVRQAEIMSLSDHE